ncbi:MAG TPA: DUF167 domain-containing protein [Candidatus Omnitrophica bacterium]|nr:MAG: DUF167 domain-containing protein [Candidatus Omnitrophota bacterium]HEC69215.1 DUF167 domain-containing protein [Candidatus Omnitrophota bacterium]
MGKVIRVKVITSASKEKIIETKDFLKIYLTLPPQKGKANKRLLELLGDYLNVRKSSLKIIKGTTSPLKLIEVKDED